MHGIGQPASRPCHTGPDRADRAVADLGRLRIGEAHDLRQHERTSAIRVERANQVLEVDELARIDRVHVRRPGAAGAATPDRGAYIIGNRSLGDGQQPRAGARLPPKARQGAQGAHVGLLGEVVSQVGPTEVGAQAPYVAVGGPGESSEGDGVAVTRRQRQHRQLVQAPPFGTYFADYSGRSWRNGNFVAVPNDYIDMECEQAREAISAQMDNEEPGLAPGALEQHVTGCAGCAAWHASLSSFAHRAGPALGEPGEAVFPAVLEALVMERAGQGERSARRALRPWRVALGAIAVGHVVLVVSSLNVGHVHDGRELGSWHLALAVGFLFAAIRPSRAWGMLPIAGALAVGMILTSGLDLLEGRALTAGELTHVIDLLGLGCLWVLARTLSSVPLRTGFVRGEPLRW